MRSQLSRGKLSASREEPASESGRYNGDHDSASFCWDETSKLRTQGRAPIFRGIGDLETNGWERTGTRSYCDWWVGGITGTAAEAGGRAARRPAGSDPGSHSYFQRLSELPATDPPGLRVAPHDRSEREAKARARSDLRRAARPAFAGGRRVRGSQPGTA